MSSRLKIIRDFLCFESECFYMPNFLKFNNLENLSMLFSLNYDFYLCRYYQFFVSKKRGLSFFFDIPSIFSNSLAALANLSVSPVVEMFSDKVICFYRPYRNSYDLVLSLKNFLSVYDEHFWFSTYQLKDLRISPKWLLKSFPLDKKILFFWILNSRTYNGSFYSPNHNFYLSILGFLFNGIVFVIILTFLPFLILLFRKLVYF